MSYEGARKAAETRRLRALGQMPAANVAIQERGAGIAPELWIEEEGTRIAVSVRFSQNGSPANAADLSDADRAMRAVRVFAWVEATSEPATLFGFHTIRVEGYASDVATLERVLPIMRRLDRFLQLVREESEDASFAKTVDSLASHLRVLRIVHVRDGKETEAKRGAAYITAHKIAETFLALHARAAA